jgi:protein ImuB
LRFVPVETVPSGAHQQALWGGAGEAGERAHRALARVQTMLGLGSVVVPVVEGGRAPTDRTQYVAWGEDRTPAREPSLPWPGRLPSPAPSVLIDPPSPAEVLDEGGAAVRVSDRGAVVRPPTRLGVSGSPPVVVTSWAGPWPVDERWWAPDEARRRARFQVALVDGRALLLSLAAGHWAVEAIYD